jgi:hypothetical protein
MGGVEGIGEQESGGLSEGLQGFLTAFDGVLLPPGLLEPFPEAPEWIDRWKKLKEREKRKSKSA